MSYTIIYVRRPALGLLTKLGRALKTNSRLIKSVDSVGRGGATTYSDKHGRFVQRRISSIKLRPSFVSPRYNSDKSENHPQNGWKFLTLLCIYIYNMYVCECMYAGPHNRGRIIVVSCVQKKKKKIIYL